MPTAFRGDPYRELDVASDASDATIKRRWRELARDHHPDRARPGTGEAATLTRRMARINAAYDLLRDRERRARFDASPAGRAAAARTRRSGNGRTEAFDPDARARGGPPSPRPSPPVTARFDTTELFHRRNATTSNGRPEYRTQPPRSVRERDGEPEPLRASKPNGPVERRAGRSNRRYPSLHEARDTLLEFGKFRGHTLGEIAAFEPTYIDWIARTITRDRDLVVSARVIQADLDERGIERRYRAPTPGFGSGRSA